LFILKSRQKRLPLKGGEAVYPYLSLLDIHLPGRCPIIELLNGVTVGKNIFGGSAVVS
jgi:hypothetical protein